MDKLIGSENFIDLLMFLLIPIFILGFFVGFFFKFGPKLFFEIAGQVFYILLDGSEGSLNVRTTSQ